MELPVQSALPLSHIPLPKVTTSVRVKTGQKRQEGSLVQKWQSQRQVLVITARQSKCVTVVASAVLGPCLIKLQEAGNAPTDPGTGLHCF